MSSSSSASSSSKAAGVPAVPAAVPETLETATEYFGYSPLSFVDDVINAANSYVYQAAEALQAYLVGKKEATGMSETEIQEGVDRIVLLMESCVDKNFDLFELYVLKNIFSIPNGLVLPHQKGLDTSNVSVAEDQELDAEIAKVHSELRSAQFTNEALKKEMDVLQKSRQSLDLAHEKLEKLQETFKSHDVKELPETFKHLMDTVTALKLSANNATRLLSTDFYVQAKKRKLEDNSSSSSTESQEAYLNPAQVGSLADVKAFLSTATTSTSS